MSGDSHESLARDYYRALDAGDYDLLAELLTASFTHDRPDVTLDGRERFVRFMRDQRPQTDTSHPIDAVYAVGSADSESDGRNGDLVVQGRLLDTDGELIVGFVDVFAFAGGRIASIRTYTR